jgi:cytochrome c biogenesis protein ResB
LAAPAFALGVLAFLALYCLVAAWFDYLAPAARPAWAVALWLDRPFRSPLFLAGSAGLLASTVACTWNRLPTLLKRWRGTVIGERYVFAARPGTDIAAFLRGRRFTGRGPVLFHHRPALWGGWILHIGIILLMFGVLAEQAFRDTGTFLLTRGQTLTLSEPGAVLDREAGPLAPPAPPALTLTLDEFDPSLHQAGYELDRASRLSVAEGEHPARAVEIDRASGVRFGGTVIYQAVRFGPSLVLQLAGEEGLRSIHLQLMTETQARALVTGPTGGTLNLWAESETPFMGPSGPGRVRFRVQTAGGERAIEPGERFDFDGAEARFARAAFWSSYTYRREAGMPAVWVGFGVILIGCTLLAFPSGVARLGPDGGAEVYLNRGGELLQSDWEALNRENAS